MNWWAEDTKRAIREQRALGQLAERSSWLSNPIKRLAEGMRVAFDFDVQIGDRTIPLTLVYPDLFPDAAPWILPRDGKRLSGHQYGSQGELCLEYRPDNWMPDITGAMMVESAHRLLSSEDQTGEAAPSEHRTSRAQQIRQSFRRLLFSPDTLSGLSGLADGQVEKGEVLEQESVVTIAAQLARIGPPDAPLWCETQKRGGKSRNVNAIVARIPEGEGRVCTSLSDLRALLWSNALPELAMDLASSLEPTFVVIFDGKRIHPLLVSGQDEGRAIATYDAIFVEKDFKRLDPEYERLKTAKVAIIGCGSIGSKVAVQLARSGVTNFVLVDSDVLASGNLVRNELDWRSVGVHKTVALSLRIDEINPACTVSPWAIAIGGQESGAVAAATLSAIEECDLIVDATADPKAFNLCASIARRASIPMCWAQAFGGGAGGIVVRLQPDVDPTPLTARQRIEGWYREQNVEWPDDGSSQPYTDASGPGAPLIADDADVTVIASHLTRFAIDLLSRPNATIFPYPAYLIGLREKWLFSAPFDVCPIDLGEADAWGTVKDADAAKDLEEFLADLDPAAVDAD